MFIDGGMAVNQGTMAKFVSGKKSAFLVAELPFPVEMLSSMDKKLFFLSFQAQKNPNNRDAVTVKHRLIWVAQHLLKV